MTSGNEKRSTAEAALRALAARQHGVFSAVQAAALGIAAPALTRRLRSGAIDRLLPGVYRIVGVPPTVRQTIVAGSLWGGPGAVLSHLTAAALWLFDGVAARDVELWVPSKRIAPPGIVVHRGEIEAIDVRMRGAMQLTSPARTLLDVATRLDDEDFEAAAESAFRRGITNPASVRRRLDAIGRSGRAGSSRLREFLERRGDQAALEYRLEVKVWRLLRANGLRPVRQYEVTSGGVTRRLDFAFPPFKVGVEANGFETHGGRLGTERDYRRVAWFVARGWRIVPVSWRDATERPAGVIDDVLGALHSATA